MAIYMYEAVDRGGKKLRGEIEGDSKEDATQKIRKKGLFPTRLQPRVLAQQAFLRASI